jgi:hypothetical protein
MHVYTHVYSAYKHTREWFEEVYTQTPEDVNRYLTSVSHEEYSESLAAQQNMKLDTLTRIGIVL